MLLWNCFFLLLCSAGNAKLKLDPVSARSTPRVGGGPEWGPEGGPEGGSRGVQKGGSTFCRNPLNIIDMSMEESTAVFSNIFQIEHVHAW